MQLGPLPLSVALPQCALPPSILFFWCSWETFPLRAPHKNSLLHATAAAFDCASVGLCQRARQKINLWFIESICCALFRYTHLSPPLSFSLPLQEMRAYCSLSLVVVIVIVACCFLSASFVQFPFLGISLYSFPIIIAAITNNRSISIGTWNGVWIDMYRIMGHIDKLATLQTAINIRKLLSVLTTVSSHHLLFIL